MILGKMKVLSKHFSKRNPRCIPYQIIRQVISFMIFPNYNLQMELFCFLSPWICFQYGKWTVRINYNDRSYRPISNTNYSAVFDENDEFVTSNHFGCDEKEWKKLLKIYVPWDIFRDYY